MPQNNNQNCRKPRQDNQSNNQANSQAENQKRQRDTRKQNEDR